MEKLQPVFLEFDRINYLRYASWYVEKIKVLRSDNRYLYDNFMAGRWVIKDKEGRFNSVSPDMKLEQTIQRVSKDDGGIIGEQRKEAYVAEWNLFFHETHQIGELLRDLTSSNLNDSRDTYIHHDLIGDSKRKTFNKMVTQLLGIIKPHGNMFALQYPPALRNILTQQNYPTDVSQKILNCLSDGKSRYDIFFKERFVEKSK